MHRPEVRYLYRSLYEATRAKPKDATRLLAMAQRIFSGTQSEEPSSSPRSRNLIQ